MRELRVLIIEDSEADALLLVRELRRHYEITFERVDTAATMERVLTEKPWDLILSDYMIPNFGGVDALLLSQKSGIDVPFIIVSGAIGEDTAVEVMKAGAHDYIMKDNLKRLIPAIDRELQEAEVRRKRREVEEALRESEERYRAFFQTSKACVFITRRDGRLIDANEAAVELFGYASREELFQIAVTDLYVNAEDRRRMGELIAKDGFVKDFTTTMRKKDGSLIFALVNAVPKRNSQGKIFAYQGTIVDLTERVRMEENLKNAEEWQRKLFNEATDAIVVAEYDSGIIVDCNDAATVLFGRDRAEIVGQPQRVLHPPHMIGGDGFSRTFRKLIDILDGESTESEVITKAGHIRTVSIKTSLFEHEGKRLILGIFRDTTEQKLTQEELARVRILEAMGILAGGIAHDFNNLLTVILGNVSMAKNCIDPADRAYEKLVKAERASLQSKDLSARLITFSRGGEPIRRKVRLDRFLEETAVLAAGGLERCSFLFPEGLWPAMIDERQMRQVVYHLLTNAFENTPKDTIVHVSAENVSLEANEILLLKEGNYVRWSVKDEGTGIAPENLPNIFDPYFTTKPMGPEKGVGLGLTVCYSIVKRHGGIITVDSAPGEGSTFHVYLQAAED
ncbi:MAG: PAS domain S-box protein [Smithellaceae bacterium]|nr:PAS domain S-box protein [Smithellaceae bacterium]